MIPVRYKQMFVTASLAGLLTSAIAVAEDARVVGGVSFKTRTLVGTNEIHLVGAAVVKRFGFKIYAGAFYLPRGMGGGDQFKDVPRKLELSYYRNIKGKLFADTTEKAISDAVSARQLKAFRADLNKLNKSYRDIRKTDRYTLSYDPASGMTLALNGKPIVSFKDKAFINAVYAIWLGDKPLDKKFRDTVFSRK